MVRNDEMVSLNALLLRTRPTPQRVFTLACTEMSSC